MNEVLLIIIGSVIVIANSILLAAGGADGGLSSEAWIASIFVSTACPGAMWLAYRQGRRMGLNEAFRIVERATNAQVAGDGNLWTIWTMARILEARDGR